MDMTRAFSGELIDLTYALSDRIPAWDGKPDFELRTVVDYDACTPPDLFRVHRITCSASLGTHIDAPAHVIPDGRTTDQLTLDELIADAVVIDMDAGPEARLSVKDIAAFEKKYGPIPPRSLVIVRSGWGRHWNEPDHYHNSHRFPSVSSEAAEALLTREIVGVAIDTFSCDTGHEGFPVHRMILGADKYLIENVANAELLPPIGAKILALPAKIQGATEAPLRLVALL